MFVYVSVFLRGSGGGKRKAKLGRVSLYHEMASVNFPAVFYVLSTPRKGDVLCVKTT